MLISLRKYNWPKFLLLSLANLAMSIKAYETETSLKKIIIGCLATLGTFTWGFLTTNQYSEKEEEIKMSEKKSEQIHKGTPETTATHEQ